jgi:UDP-4-amino-4,6-dideoxy-N-acetyl-beta-L-altrosamine N-acetyltransferase
MIRTLHGYGLRELTTSDDDLLVSWHNSEAAREHSFGDSMITPQGKAAWVRSLEHNSQRPLIFHRLNEPIGFIRFSDIQPRHGTAYWTLLIGRHPSVAGEGTVMAFLAIEFAFARMGLRKVLANVLGSNLRSLSLHTRLGFTEEGVLRDNIIKHSLSLNVHILSLFAYQWDSYLRDEVLHHCLSLRGLTSN